VRAARAPFSAFSTDWIISVGNSFDCWHFPEWGEVLGVRAFVASFAYYSHTGRNPLFFRYPAGAGLLLNSYPFF
jgi:hypothetical protein